VAFAIRPESGNQPWLNVTLTTITGCDGERQTMTLRHIFNDLQSLDHQGSAATTAARAGYFHWILSQADVASARQAAHLAMRWMQPTPDKSQAAAEFTRMIGETVDLAICAPVRRGGAAGRRRVLH
jgi:hypothetical protein